MKFASITVLTFAVSTLCPWALYAQDIPFAKVLAATGSVKIRNAEIHLSPDVIRHFERITTVGTDPGSAR